MPLARPASGKPDFGRSFGGRAGVLITFMLASDYGLVQFVQKVTEMCRGKARISRAPYLGQYLLMDYMSRKTKTIH
jgi:Ca-activated chloride channel family protein